MIVRQYPKAAPPIVVEYRHPTLGPITRLEPALWPAGHPKAGQLAIFANEQEEKEFNKQMPTKHKAKSKPKKQMKPKKEMKKQTKKGRK
jgi:hypothetical protein